MGLEHFVPSHRFERFRRRVQKRGRSRWRLPRCCRPPFPLTPFVLTCGALEIDRWIFFSTFALMRLIRFGAEAALARVYGRGVLRVIESQPFQMVVVGFIIIAVAGTLISGILLWRNARQPRLRPA